MPAEQRNTARQCLVANLLSRHTVNRALLGSLRRLRIRVRRKCSFFDTPGPSGDARRPIILRFTRQALLRTCVWRRLCRMLRAAQDARAHKPAGSRASFGERILVAVHPWFGERTRFLRKSSEKFLGGPVIRRRGQGLPVSRSFTQETIPVED